MMKLNLLLIVMDMLTVLVYPIVFVHSKLRRFYISKEIIPVRNFLIAIPVTPGR